MHDARLVAILGGRAAAEGHDGDRRGAFTHGANACRPKVSSVSGETTCTNNKLQRGRRIPFGATRCRAPMARAMPLRSGVTR